MGKSISAASFAEQKKLYFAKSGDTKIARGHLDKRGDKGFAVYSIYEDTLRISQLFSTSKAHGDFWYGVFDKLTKDHDLKFVRFETRRNGDAMARRFGAKVVGSILEVEL